MILIVGGTGEAMALARRLAERPDIPAMLSLAGRTQSPVLPPIPHRIGGFGGVEGLAAYIFAHGVTLIIDATHPFATRMKANAAMAAQATGRRMLALRRPAWSRVPGDDWTEVADAAAARAALKPSQERVFLTVGRLELPAFVDDGGRFYLVRSVDPPDAMPPDSRLILDRGPFRLDEELAVMREARIDVLVTKNSGGAATAAKIEAARTLRLPVILMTRPAGPEVPSVTTVDEAFAAIIKHAEGSDL